MTAPDLTKLTADELLASATDMSLLPDTYPRELMQIRGVDLDELHRRAQANDRLRAAAEKALAFWCPTHSDSDSHMCGAIYIPPRACDCGAAAEFQAKDTLQAALTAAPAAQPTPAAPVTDAEIEAAIKSLEAHVASYQWSTTLGGLLEVNKRRSELVALIARRVASAGAAPVDPWTPSQCDYDRSIHNNPDANAWADFFVQVHPGLADKHDVMRGWFANAMMAMHDSPRCRPAPVDKLRAEVERLRADANARAVEELRRVQQWAMANCAEMIYHGRAFASTHMAVSCAQVKLMVEDRIAELSKPAAKESEPAKPVTGPNYLDQEEWGHTKPEEPDWTVTLAAQANVASVRADKARLLTLIVEGLCNLGREVRRGGKS